MLRREPARHSPTAKQSESMTLRLLSPEKVTDASSDAGNVDLAILSVSVRARTLLYCTAWSFELKVRATERIATLTNALERDVRSIRRSPPPRATPVGTTKRVRADRAEARRRCAQRKTPKNGGIACRVRRLRTTAVKLGRVRRRLLVAIHRLAGACAARCRLPPA
jgi:hypothetical protein